MNIRLIGLGRMGSNFALNCRDHHHQVIGYDANEEARNRLKAQGFQVVRSLSELTRREPDERLVIWLLVPNQLVDAVLEQLVPLLAKHDIVIDGGNSNFNLSIKHYQYLKSKGIDYIDLGTSGGIHGARHGACLMAGGERDVVAYVEPVFRDVAIENGYAYVGRPGSGHFVKMVHNGIEYGMMQAIAEGFDLLQASPFELDHKAISKMWNHGSIIESALLGFTHDAFAKDATLSSIAGRIDDSGEGMWMIEEALKYKVSVPVITQALFARYKSRDDERFGEKVVAAMRAEFGGHAVYKKKT
ncbi:MAG: decarboxylating 6-phosphogluconate dehydrogenase [Acholeplasmataceae bacterium]|nr:MAG: decarboxylating 6-phosphogluconate dehydrogenase [Acholeplasmataceae bacterium]